MIDLKHTRVANERRPPIRVVIADDEINARIMLKAMLAECRDSSRLDIVGEVEDGKSLISIVGIEQPDLVFVDVKMPLCNGLEAIRECNNAGGQIQWIIVSGFSTFDYAHEALHLGVVDYLLKPVDPERLSAVIIRVEHRLHERYVRENLAFERRCAEVFSKGENVTLPEDLISDTRKCFFYRIDLDGPLRRPDDSAPALRDRVIAAVRGSIYELVHDSLHVACVPMDRKTVLVLITAGRMIGENSSRRIEEAIRDALSDSAEVFWSVTSSYTDDVTTAVDGLSRLHDRSLLRVIRDSFGHVSRCGDADTDQRDFCKAFFSMLESFTRRDYIGFMKEIGQLEGLVPDTDLGPGALKHAWEFLGHTLFPEVKGFSPHRSVPDDWGDLFRVLSTDVASGLRHGCGTDHTITTILEYLDTHYMEDIGVCTIADMLGVTPNYLSTLFRRECRKTFMQHITELRLEKAKALLAGEGGLSVREISSLVGYRSSRYFSKQFLRHVGVHPSDYRRGKDL